MSLKLAILEDIKAAMRAKDAAKLLVLRMLTADLKQKEVDLRVEVSDADVLASIARMLKQRRDSISQFDAAGRVDLADAERAEVVVLEAYLPQAMSDAEVDHAILAAIASANAIGPQDMGKVMALLKPALMGKADIAVVSQKVKQKLSGN